MKWYILNDFDQPVETDVSVASAWRQANWTKSIVGKDFAQDGYFEVSTVFLGLDHSDLFGQNGGKPILWETMVFPGPAHPDGPSMMEFYCERYTSFADALRGHRKIIQAIETGKMIL